MSVTYCDDSVRGTGRPGTVLNHHSCLSLVASSSYAASANARFEWHALTFDDSNALVTDVVIGSAETLQKIVFRDDARNLTKAAIQLTVIDGNGRKSSVQEDYVLTNTPPTLSLGSQRIVRPRGELLLLSPFFVVTAQPADEDCDIDPDTNALACDRVQLDVTQLDSIDGLALQASRCSEVPQRTTYVDPAPDDPLAWCFDVLPQDNPNTPQNEAQLFPAAITVDASIDLRFRIEAHNLGVAPSGSSCATETEDHTVDCQVIRFEDVVWVATNVHGAAGVLGGNGDLETTPGVVGRIAPDWGRAGDVLADTLDGRGVATVGERYQTVFAGRTLAPCDPATSDCPGALVGYDPFLQAAWTFGIGEIIGMEQALYGNGLWISAVSVTSSGNPGAATASGRQVIPPGQPYIVHVPTNRLSVSGAVTTLVNVPPSAMLYVVGFYHPAVPSFEVPVAYIEVEDALWLASIESTGPGNATYHLRHIDGTYVSNSVVDLEAGVPDVAAGVGEIPFYTGSNLDLFAAHENGQVWFLDRTYVDGEAFVRARLLDATGATSLRTYTFPGQPSAIAYEPGIGATDRLWVADVEAGVVAVYDDADDPAHPNTPDYFVSGLSLPVGLSIGYDGTVWVEELLNGGALRRTSRLTPGSFEPTRLSEYASRGIGIDSAVSPYFLPQSVWQRDLAGPVVASADNAEEVPALTFGSPRSRLAGVDAYDGSAYVITPSQGLNLVRIGPYGDASPLAALDRRPIAGHLLPSFTQDVEGTRYFIEGRLWLAVAGTGGNIGLVSITKRHLDTLALSPAQGDLPDCASTTENVPCFETNIPLELSDGTPFFPDQIIGSLFDGHLYMLGRGNLTGPYLVAFWPHSTIFPAPYVFLEQPLGLPDVAQVPNALSMCAVLDDSDVNFSYGAFLVRGGGDVQRWYVANPFAANASLAADAPIAGTSIPGYRARAVANDFISRAFWTVYDDVDPGQPQLLVRWDASANASGAVVLTSANGIVLPAQADALAPATFASAVYWTGGRDGYTGRVRAIHFPDGWFVGSDYVRPPDANGSIGTTPAGTSLMTGGY